MLQRAAVPRGSLFVYKGFDLGADGQGLFTGQPRRLLAHARRGGTCSAGLLRGGRARGGEARGRSFSRREAKAGGFRGEAPRPTRYRSHAFGPAGRARRAAHGRVIAAHRRCERSGFGGDAQDGRRRPAKWRILSRKALLRRPPRRARRRRRRRAARWARAVPRRFAGVRGRVARGAARDCDKTSPRLRARRSLPRPRRRSHRARRPRPRGAARGGGAAAGPGQRDCEDSAEEAAEGNKRGHQMCR
mmetsp:Transcript_12443/g.41476  ORF Transcript_12443/g.41476 Transcript_12443/m.41476 type:complete len:246 (-) Transcript_12443:798-1535(-)